MLATPRTSVPPRSYHDQVSFRLLRCSAVLMLLASIRVLCVDDHPLIRKGIASILQHEPDMVLVGEAADGREAVHLFRELAPDVTLMDLRMPLLDGISATRLIRKE